MRSPRRYSACTRSAVSGTARVKPGGVAYALGVTHYSWGPVLTVVSRLARGRPQAGTWPGDLVMQDLRFVWLELTGRCPLLCDHCYAGSGPKGTDGAMLPEDWLRVIDEVAQLGGRDGAVHRR